MSAEAESGARGPGWRADVAFAALLVLAIAVAFGGAVANGSIVLDDPEYVFANGPVLAGLTWRGFLWPLTSVHGGNWHPLTSWSHMLDVQLFGTQPAGHHAVSIALHAVAAVTAFFALCRLCASCPASRWTSFAIALLFAVHPLRVESVAWIAERKDVLSGVFFWATLLAYARWVERPSRARAPLLIVAFALGLMSKPMLVTVPCVLLLLDIWPLRRLGPDGAQSWRIGPRMREKLPLFALAAVSCVTTYWAQHAAGAMETAKSMPFSQRMANAPVALVGYVRTSFWPTDLAPYYPFEVRDSALVPLLCLAALIAFTLLAWRQLRVRPWLAVGWAWFVGMLVPVLGIVQVGGQASADRYTYLPTVGLVIIVVFAAREVWARWPGSRVPIGLLFAAACVACIAMTRAQVSHWRSTRALAEHTLAATSERNAFAHGMYAMALIQDGDVAEARAHLVTALEIVPDLPRAHDELGYLYTLENRFDAAAVEYRAEANAHPTTSAWFNLGFSLSQIGRTNEAIEAFEQALRLDPNHERTLVRLGIALAIAGRPAESVARFESARRVAPDDLEALRGLAAAHLMNGESGLGVSCFEELLQRSPDDVEVLRQLAWTRATDRDPRVRDASKALLAAERARKLARGEDAALLGILAAAEAEAGRYPDAVAHADRAVQLARAANDTATAERVARQLESYRAGKPLYP